MKNYQKQKPDVYQIITNHILDKLESGVIPWHKPWSSYGPACSYLTRKPYRGINALLLNIQPVEKPFYLTFKQVKELGGQVKKGSRSLPVVYWKIVMRDANTGKPISDEQAKTMAPDQLTSSAFMKYYSVFHLDQIEGIDFELPDIKLQPDNTTIDNCEQIISEMPNKPAIQFKDTSSAYYAPHADMINMPELKYFESSEMYYSVLFHELTHATGNSTRLNRPEIVSVNTFGSEDYSREELVAELGASFLCGHAIPQNLTWRLQAG